MMIRKDDYRNENGYVNMGYAFEMCAPQTFPDFVKGSKDDDMNGIDGFITFMGKKVSVQLKCGIHSDGGEDPMHGYSVVHRTSQRKLTNVDYLILGLPSIVRWGRYKLDHTLGIVYVVKRTEAIKRKLLKYNKKGEIYFPKESRLILKQMESDKKAFAMDIITVV